MPAAATEAEDAREITTEEPTVPIAMLRTADDVESDTAGGADTSDEEEAAGEVVPIPEPEDQVEEVVESSPEPATPIEEAATVEPDEMDSELADLIEEAAAEERRDPEPAVVTQPPEEEQRPARRRPSIRRRRPAAEQPVTALPLTYVEDPKQLTRYRIRWALTLIILVVMFFILLWASRELLSALSEVRQAVTPGGIGS